MLRVRASTVNGSTAAPASKSATHRALALALLARKSRIRDPLLSEDTRASLAAVEALGGKVVREDGTFAIEGGTIATPANVLDCLNSGTTLRLFTALAAQQRAHAILTGDASLRARPMQPLLDALVDLGADARSARGDGCAPVIVRGPLTPGRARIAGDVSSQFVSALILAATRTAGGETRIDLTTPLKSRPYVALTLAALRKFGGTAKEAGGGFVVAGAQDLGGADYRVPGDWSSAAFPLVAAAITGGEVRVTNLDPLDVQGDREILGILKVFGAHVSPHDGGATVRGGSLTGAHVDLADTPDLFPALCALAAAAKGESTLSGAEHLRFKESDRIAAMKRNLSAMGVRCEERRDGLVVHGGSPVKGATLSTEGDHRILMASALLALVAEGETRLDEEASAAVSYPGFVEAMNALGAKMEVTE